MSNTAKPIRIHKFLSAQGVASRRAVEQMLLEGRITVNDKLPARLPCMVTPGKDNIRVDGRLVSNRPAGKVYYLLNKPKGVVCTQSDPQGRPKAVDLVPKTPTRVYCAGRLDADSTGIIVVTNDGELTKLLTHPRYGVPKTYVVEVDGHVAGEQVDKLKAGGWLDGKRTQRVSVKILRRGPKRSTLSIRLTEGRNREIRRLLARSGHKVRKLKRVSIGPITDRGLKPGSFRELTPHQVARLRQSVDADKPPRSRPKRSR